MSLCWRSKPESRPLFDSLEESISKYIELNETYSSKFWHQNDYSALKAAVLAPLAPKTNTPDGYVPMNTKMNGLMSDDVDGCEKHPEFCSLNSSANNNVNSSESQLCSETPIIPEEIPMVELSNGSIPTNE